MFSPEQFSDPYFAANTPAADLLRLNSTFGEWRQGHEYGENLDRMLEAARYVAEDGLPGINLFNCPVQVAVADALHRVGSLTYDENLIGISCRYLGSGLPVIGSFIRQNRDTDRDLEMFRAMETVIEQDHDRVTTSSAYRILIESVPASIRSASNISPFLPHLAFLVAHAEKDTSRELTAAVADLVQDDNPETGVGVSNWLNKKMLFYTERGLNYDRWNSLFNGVLGSYGVDPEQLRDAWVASFSKPSKFENPFLYQGINFLAMAGLDRIKKGISRQLFTDFGVADYGRYPQQALTDFYFKAEKSRGNKSGMKAGAKLAAMVLPFGDYNGAFYRDRQTIEDFSGRWGKENYFGFIEAATRDAVDDRLGRLTGVFGTRVETGLIGGHGNTGFMELDDTGSSREIYRPADMRSLVERFFAPDPTLILLSCLGGIPDGLAQQSSSGGGTFIGADGKIDEFKIEVHPSMKDYKVDYFYNGNPVPVRVYRGGLDITGEYMQKFSTRG